MAALFFRDRAAVVTLTKTRIYFGEQVFLTPLLFVQNHFSQDMKQQGNVFILVVT